MKGYVRVPAGSFLMGSAADEAEFEALEGPQHRVHLGRSFWLKATPVTQGEWEAVMGANPSRFAACGADCPVEQVSWEDAVAYLNALSDREGLERCYEGAVFKGAGCLGYRLPTEAEWEYAARAGTSGARYGELTRIAWCWESSGDRTRPVGAKAPNAWGLYDMLGNVYEWVQDWEGAYAGEEATDPVGPASGAYRVLRGGGWSGDLRDVRAAYRASAPPDHRSDLVGFRPARSIP